MIFQRNGSEKKRTVLLVGATGLVGGHCLRFLQQNPEVGRIVVLARRPLERTTLAARTVQMQIDFERPREYQDQFAVEQVFICLGTTRKAAGSKKAFTRIDYGIPLEIARISAEKNVSDLLLISSLGADARSPLFYFRTKGRLEAEIARLPFRSVTILRPSSLTGHREEPRVREIMVAIYNSLLGFLFVGPFKKYQPIGAEDVARAMVHLSDAPVAGVRIVESTDIRVAAETQRMQANR
jgi:uncharacterized protein YbjT (DUF2867 family)